MCAQKIVFVGLFVSSNSLKDLVVCRGFLAIEQGKITQKGTTIEFECLKHEGVLKDFEIIYLKESQFLMPGFVDCHTHAPQFPNIGLGLDRPLLEWLAKYTFPLEMSYSDIDFASRVYDKAVQRLINNGTTTSCYFGTLHLGGTLELAKSVMKHRQRALVGKVSMNLKNDAGYYNDTKKEIQEVETFVQKILEFKDDLIEPIVTPRFAVSCDEELLTALSKIAQKYKCRIQSHISENRDEIETVLKLFPNYKSYTDVYDKCNILSEKCIMAHAIYLSDEEITLFADKGVAIAHCPASNTRLKSGLCPVRKYLDKNITVGLGTDVAGGDSASILDAIRRTMDVSTHLELEGKESYSLDWKESFYLATLGGAKALGLDSKIGSLDTGKDFDALLIDVYVKGSQIKQYDISGRIEDLDIGLIQKFIYCGDDRNILQVYVQGKKLKDMHISSST